MDIWSQLTALADCLCAKLAETGSDPLCFCGVMAGDQPYDFSGIGDCGDGCGQAWVRLVNSYPSSRLGEADTSANNCDKGLGFDVEVGLLRCWPIEAEADGEPVDAATMMAVAAQHTSDMLLMRRAIACCDKIDQHLLGQWNPVGPESGLIGGTWTLYLGE